MGSEQSTEIKTGPIIKTEETDDCSSSEGMRTFPSKNGQRIVNTEEANLCSSPEGIGGFQSGSRPEVFEEYQFARETAMSNKEQNDERSGDNGEDRRGQHQSLDEQLQEVTNQQEILRREQQKLSKKRKALVKKIRALGNQRKSEKRIRQWRSIFECLHNPSPNAEFARPNVHEFARPNLQEFARPNVLEFARFNNVSCAQDPFTRAEIARYKDWELAKSNNVECAQIVHWKLTKCSNCDGFEKADIMFICVSCTRNMHRVDVLSPRFPEVNVPLEEFVVCSKCAQKEHPDDYVHLRMNYSFLAQKHAPILNKMRAVQKPIVKNLAKRKIDDVKVVKKEVPVSMKTPKAEPKF